VAILNKVINLEVPAPSTVVTTLPPEVDIIALCALERDREDRFPTARDMAIAIEKSLPLASQREVGEWVERMAGDTLRARIARIEEIEQATASGTVPPPPNVPLTSKTPNTLTEPPWSRSLKDAARPLRSIGASVQRSTTKVLAWCERRMTESASRSPRLWMGGGATMAAVSLALFAWIVWPRGAPKEASSVPAPPSAEPLPPPVAPPAPPLVDLDEPNDPAPDNSASDISSAKTPPRGKPPAVVPVKGGARCNPPYTVDRNGVRVPKLDCL
jgi:hypothetical protein